MEKQIRKNLLGATIFLVIVAFVSGIIIGRNIAEMKPQEITMFLKENELKTDSYIIEQELLESFDEDNCEIAQLRIQELSEELYTLGKVLGQNETENALVKENYDLLKRKYHLTQIRTYILLHKSIKNCDAHKDVVLFYFGKNDPASAEQGKILDEIVKRRDVAVYAIEYNYSSDLTFLEEYYGIKKAPALVLNYETVKQGLTPYADVIAIIDQNK